MADCRNHFYFLLLFHFYNIFIIYSYVIVTFLVNCFLCTRHFCNNTMANHVVCGTKQKENQILQWKKLLYLWLGFCLVCRMRLLFCHLFRYYLCVNGDSGTAIQHVCNRRNKYRNYKPFNANSVKLLTEFIIKILFIELDIRLGNCTLFVWNKFKTAYNSILHAKKNALISTRAMCKAHNHIKTFISFFVFSFFFLCSVKCRYCYLPCHFVTISNDG